MNKRFEYTTCVCYEWNYETEKLEPKYTYEVFDTLTDAVPIELTDEDDAEWLTELLNTLPNKTIIERFAEPW